MALLLAIYRVLLTSIPGAAITHVKIEGVDHEFSSIKGVRDVAKHNNEFKISQV